MLVTAILWQDFHLGHVSS